MKYKVFFSSLVLFSLIALSVYTLSKGLFNYAFHFFIYDFVGYSVQLSETFSSFVVLSPSLFFTSLYHLLFALFVFSLSFLIVKKLPQTIGYSK